MIRFWITIAILLVAFNCSAEEYYLDPECTIPYEGKLEGLYPPLYGNPEEVPPLDFSEYVVGEIYENPDGTSILVDEISQDKKEMTSRWVVHPELDLTWEREVLERLTEIKELLTDKR